MSRYPGLLRTPEGRDCNRHDEPFHDRRHGFHLLKPCATGAGHYGILGRGKLLLPKLFLAQIGLAQAGNQGQRLSLPALRLLVSTQKQEIAHRQLTRARPLARPSRAFTSGRIPFAVSQTAQVHPRWRLCRDDGSHPGRPRTQLLFPALRNHPFARGRSPSP